MGAQDPGINDRGVEAFLRSCRILSDGFVARSESDRWRLGAIVFARSDQSFAAIQKAAPSSGTYEFKDLWALPGGMVRASNRQAGWGESEIAQLTIASSRQRADVEAGFPADHPQSLVPVGSLGPIVTNYTAKGQQRYTLVVVLEFEVSEPFELSPRDHSVQASRWMELPLRWDRFAPANRLAIAHLLWSRLSAEQKETARAPVEEAAMQCATWASDTGWPSPPRPWDPPSDLEKWRSAFVAA
jgi:hypothetical protein